MNISFINKSALCVLLVATCLTAFWRYEITVTQPRQNAVLKSFETTLQDREKIEDNLRRLKDIRSGVENVAGQGRLTDAVVGSMQKALADILSSEDRLLAGNRRAIEGFGRDLNDFLKITNQMDLYERKIKEFSDRFTVYFQVFESDISTWKEQTAGAIMAGTAVTNTLPVGDMIQRISTLQKIIPEFGAFEQKLQDLKGSIDQWVNDINVAQTLEEKQTVFGQKQYLLKGFADLFGTFNNYLLRTIEQENANVRQIAGQIYASMNVIEQPLVEQFGALNNAIETQVIQNKIKDRQYRDIKRVVFIGLVFALIGIFVAMVLYALRFERGMALFKRQTFKASTDSREITVALNDHATGMIRNFELARTMQEGLQEASEGFTQRQLNLQRIDQLVRDTDLLIKESRENFMVIKEEFYNTEKVSKEIVHLTGALDGVAQQMSMIAERAALNVADNYQQAAGKQDTIDELKYLSSRIRHAVSSTHTALEARKDKIDEAKGKFELIEKNMDQMTDNTRFALTEIAHARLDHSQEAHRINEILENAKAKSRYIADEINGLNQQIRDFSVLSKHLEALHELAVKASALNAQSLLVTSSDPQVLPVIESSSRRMNDYIKEYFTKVFESDVLKPSAQDELPGIDDGFSQDPSQKPASRIEETIKNT